MVTKLQKLILKHVIDLGQAAFTEHENLCRYRKEPLDGLEEVKISMRHNNALEKQAEWINALIGET